VPGAAVLAGCGAGTLPAPIDPDGDADSDTDGDGDADSDSDAGDMIQVPEGEFLMGWVEDLGTDRPECRFGDTEPHDVWLSAFEIDRAEVTQAAYSGCVQAGVCDTPACEWDPAGKPTYPVACVDRSRASVFCEWRAARLPTEIAGTRAAAREVAAILSRLLDDES
jgi:formylglycine-generating enzyme required for sulfatase activity